MRSRPALIAALAISLLAVSAIIAATGPAAAQPAPLPTVIGKQVLGHSVQGRDIVAYHLGTPGAPIRAVVLGQMHGDEHEGVRIAHDIIDGRAITGIDLWVVPTMNPDGNHSNKRQNAHKVDLNRNWPDKWRPLTGTFYSGPKPLSEPETRAMRTFLLGFRPTLLVSLHQPLNGVDTTDGGATNPAFRNRLAANLGLPLKAFRCGGVCHGSMTGWLTTYDLSDGITVEYGWAPSSTQRARAPRGIVYAFGGQYDTVAAHSPLGKLEDASANDGSVHLAGWAFDPDDTSRAITMQVLEGTTVLRSNATNVMRTDVNAARHIAGVHGFAVTIEATPGEHRYCVRFVNIGPGSRDTTPCATVVVNADPSTSSPSG